MTVLTERKEHVYLGLIRLSNDLAEAGKAEESMSHLHADYRTEGARSGGFEKQVKPVLDLVDLGVNDTCLWATSQKLWAGNSLDTLTILNKNNGQYL